INPRDPVAALKKRLSPDEDAFKNLSLAGILSKDPTLPKDPKEMIDLINAGRSAQSRGDHNWPPIISLSEADGYFFKVGSAELDDTFKARLRDKIIPRLIELAHEYKVDVIEVIGHTDEQPIVQRSSNLDISLLGVLKGNGGVQTLIPADNAGLGIARAVAV